jgi:hypothetical protein
MPHVRYVHLTKAQHIHKKECYTRIVAVRVQLHSAHEPQEACRQDELIDVLSCEPVKGDNLEAAVGEFSPGANS